MSNNHNHYNKNPLELVTTDIFDLITVNGRISKKLVEKVIIPEIDRYYESLREITKLKRALEVANEAIGFYANNVASVFDCDGENLLEDCSQCSREAQKQIKEIMES